MLPDDRPLLVLLLQQLGGELQACYSICCVAYDAPLHMLRTFEATDSAPMCGMQLSLL